ncbi:MAG: ribonuclease P protein component [Coriobacteriaceae bacterium]|nr:ribonuclease P protein component [Coriobacteriaceae bacterium]
MRIGSGRPAPLAGGAVTTIKTSREIDRVFRDGARVSHPLITAIGAISPAEAAGAGRVAFIAGKKVGGAVRRNRAKRVMREACRRTGGPWAGWDIALVARAETGASGASELEAALSALVRRLGAAS